MAPIYCINLAAQVGRRRRMSARFAHHGLHDVRFVDALSSDDGEVREIAAGAADVHLPAVACLRSHLRALRRFLDETPPDVEAAIVMEDDAVLHDDFRSRLDVVLANAEPGTPLIALGYLVWHWDEIRWCGREPSLENLATLHPSHVWGTQAYWISRPEATRALERYDRPLSELPAGVTAEAITRWSNGAIAYPPLVLEEAFDSSIGDEERLRHHDTAQRGFDHASYAGAERAARDTTIALCMIVRDEAAVIERCLESVRPLIDAWVICDTGSSDATVELIERSLAGIPGALHHRPWVDFGHNRSELMSLARGCADHLLLLDADQTIRQIGFLPPLSSDVDAYLLRHSGDPEYDVARLVRGDLPWRFEGRTHEYLTLDDRDVRYDRVRAWRVVHHGDGSSRSVKFERDAELLRRTLDERPDDPRTMFYLAQTLESLGRTAAARALYERRARAGAFEEEAWYAQWRAAALIDADRHAERLGALLAAWSRRPTRLEPLHDAIEVCASQGWWDLACSLARTGVEIERPDDILFVHPRLYEETLRADLDRAMVALGRRPHGHPGPAPTAGAPTLEELVPNARFAQVELDPPTPWPAFNPSIAASDDAAAMIVRTANYLIDHDGHYVPVDGARRDPEAGPTRAAMVVRTQNYFVRLAPDLVAVDARPIVDRSGRETHDTAVRGLEDLRLFRHEGRWWALATSRDSDPSAIARILLLDLDDDADDEVSVVSARLLDASHPDVHEKNWSPYIRDGQLKLVDRWDPRRIWAWRGDVDHGALTLELDERDRPERSKLRGSTPGVPFGDAHLFVVHEVSAGPGGRIYRHRFVSLGADGSMRTSPAFSFAGASIEFAAGLALRGEDVVVSFGVDDRVAALAVVPCDAVADLLSEQPISID